MPNVIIKPWDQSAPTWRHDPQLAREAAEAKDKVKASRQDWDAINWQALHPEARRRRMRNQSWEREWDAPGHHDPLLSLLEQRAYIERIELRPEEWVEESLELYEANCQASRAYRLPDQERWEQVEQRMVNIMHPSAILRKLRAAGVDARDECHPRARIWLNDWTRYGLVGVNAWVKPAELDDEGYLIGLSEATSQAQKQLLTYNFLAAREGRLVQRTLTSLQEPYGPEWSVMRFNSHGVATKEKFRGWRTAMLALIIADVLTEQEVDRAFGPPIGEAGAWYRSQLQAWRHVKMGRMV